MDRFDELPTDVLDRMSDGVVALDGEFNYVYVNPRAERILGRTGDDLLGNCIWDEFPELAGTVTQEHIRTAAKTGTPVQFEQFYPGLEQSIEIRVYPGDGGVTILFADVTDSKATERKLDQILETTPVGIAILDPDGGIARANVRAEELLGLDHEEMEGRGYDHPEWDIWDESGAPISREDHPVTRVLETNEPVFGFTHGITLPDDSERWLSSNVAPVYDGDGAIEHLIVALEDVTALKRLEQLIEVLRPVNEVLNRASDRTDVERTISDILAETSEYDLVWFGERLPGPDVIETRVYRGSATTDRDDIGERLTELSTNSQPATVAVETGDLVVVSRDTAESGYGPWSALPLAARFHSLALVPLAHQGQLYGLLGLFTERVGAFDEREQMLLGTLGDRIGRIYHSLETEALLHANRVVELTFRSRDRNSFLVRAAGECDCTIDVVDTIPTSDGGLVHYLNVRGTSVDAVVERAESASAAVEARALRSKPESVGGDVELRLDKQSIAQAIVSLGAVVTSDTVTRGQETVVCEIPADRDAEQVVRNLTASFPDTTLVSKRGYDRPVESTAEDAIQVATDAYQTELTDRQRQVLRVAVHAGYFESPRVSTATEIADALSLTQSTVSYHLRNAQQTLFERMFQHFQSADTQ